MEKIKIRGLVRSAGWIFLLWGAVIAVKGVRDILFGEPEANYFSPQKWEFISLQQWHTWSGFEIIYGLASVAIAIILWKYAPRLPEYIERTPRADSGLL
jgi:hypothetical protein